MADTRHRTTDPVRAIDEDGRRWTASVDAGGDLTSAESTKRDLLAWVLDRTDIPALPALEPWRNRSTWERPNT